MTAINGRRGDREKRKDRIRKETERSRKKNRLNEGYKRIIPNKEKYKRHK